jgi:hypothetical protein
MDISQPIEDAISRYVSQWMEQHPFWAWIFTHPLPSLGLLLLVLFLLWGLLKAIGRGTEQIWLFLLRTPFKLLRPLFLAIGIWIKRLLTGESTPDHPRSGQMAAISTQPRILAILDRLHTLKQEQDLLLAELEELVRLPQD